MEIIFLMMVAPMNAVFQPVETVLFRRGKSAMIAIWTIQIVVSIVA